MSAIISVGLLVKRREEAEKMAARAKELIEETVPQDMKPGACVTAHLTLNSPPPAGSTRCWYGRSSEEIRRK